MLSDSVLYAESVSLLDVSCAIILDFLLPCNCFVDFLLSFVRFIVVLAKLCFTAYINLAIFICGSHASMCRLFIHLITCL